MPEVTCALVEDLLDLYLDGETNQETARLLEDHIDRCTRCQARVGQRRQARARLARLAWGNRELADVLGADARVIAMARRRLRRAALRAVALVAAAAVAGWAGAWFLSAPAPPGMYLARFTASQLVVDGRTGLSIPFLWVPEYPGQQPPELWLVEIPCAAGKGLTLKVAAVTLEGGTYGPLRYQRGRIIARQQEGIHTEFGNGTSTFYPTEPALEPLWEEDTLPYIARQASGIIVIARGGQVLATSQDIDLTLVQWNDHSVAPYRPVPGPDGTCRSVSGVGSGMGGCFVYLRPDAPGIELVDVVLPASYFPLRVEGPDGVSEPLELPRQIPPDWCRLLGQAPAVRGVSVLETIVVLRVSGETYYEQASQSMSYSPNTPLRELYDLGQPE